MVEVRYIRRVKYTNLQDNECSLTSFETLFIKSVTCDSIEPVNIKASLACSTIKYTDCECDIIKSEMTFTAICNVFKIYLLAFCSGDFNVDKFSDDDL